ncbi:MAG TPA: carboxypeptidase regulatory-like domain-containing protein [Longimicrobiales bacterium]
MPPPRARPAVSAVLLMAAAVCPLRAQVVVGRLVDASANRPIAAAFVQLLDSAGVRRAGALTDSTGRFVLRADADGTYRLRAERLGYEPVTSPALRLGATPLDYVFSLTPRALVLPAVSARSEDSRGCERRPDGRAVYALWNAVRTALGVASWTQATGALRFSVMNYFRELDPSLRDIRREERTPAYSAVVLPYRAVDPDHLARVGYLIADGRDSWLLGPDADVLLSEPFLNSHCFRIIDSPDTGVVGLGFEPLRRDELADVSGVLWVDRRTAELRYLAFEFENLPDHLRNFGASGQVHFRRLENGIWIIDRWWIRSPQVGNRRGMRRYRLLGHREDGGTVTSVTPLDAERRPEGGRGLIEGFVLDSTTSAPLSGALVFLEGTRFSAQTSTTGRYLIQRIPGGRYAIGFTHPVLEELGVALPVDSITITGSLPLQRVFAGPSMTTILRTVCPGEVEEPTTGLVYGAVHDEHTGEPVEGVDVHASWRGLPPSGSGRTVDRVRSTRTRPDGRYFLCWVPTDRELELRADTRRVRHPAVKVHLSGSPMLRREFY